MGDSQVQANTYLFYAQKLLLLESAGPLLDSANSISDQQSSTAIYAGACLCLKQSWEAWLKELASYINEDIDSFASITQSPLDSFPESQCLLSFKPDPNSWLNRLLSLIEKPVQNIQRKQTVIEKETTSKLISIVSTDDESTMCEYEVLSQTLEEFKQYMQSVRSRQAEW